MLEFEGPPLDPAIVSAQPMKPPQMVCPPGWHTDFNTLLLKQKFLFTHPHGVSHGRVCFCLVFFN